MKCPAPYPWVYAYPVLGTTGLNQHLIYVLYVTRYIIFSFAFRRTSTPSSVRLILAVRFTAQQLAVNPCTNTLVKWRWRRRAPKRVGERKCQIGALNVGLDEYSGDVTDGLHNVKIPQRTCLDGTTTYRGLSGNPVVDGFVWTRKFWETLILCVCFGVRR